jgi:XTP/dITP diphosphohydrolase
LKIIFATHNKGKLEEVRKLLNQTTIELLSLDDIHFSNEIPEDYQTLQENAIQKAAFIFEKFKIPTFADDSGLLVEALDGQPGVFSARYAGEHGNHEANMSKLLHELSGVLNRKAHFKTVIAFVDEKQTKVFEGIVEGEITLEKKGEKGFGYDPIFQPNGCAQTFAEMELSEKNSMSHRGKALKKLTDFLFFMN